MRESLVSAQLGVRFHVHLPTSLPARACAFHCAATESNRLLRNIMVRTGSCVSLVEGLDAIGIQFQEQLDSINDYMEVCSVPVAMRRRVRNYLWNYKELQGRKVSGYDAEANTRRNLATLSPCF